MHENEIAKGGSSMLSRSHLWTLLLVAYGWSWLFRAPAALSAEGFEIPSALNAVSGLDADVPLYLAFIRRFDPGFERLRKAVQSGELGRVFHVQTTYNYYTPDHLSPPYSTILAWLKKTTGFDLE